MILSASIIVFFVALPLCLGIALASDAPLMAGVIAGVIGGVVVGVASGSQLGVSGPAAGLAVVVASAITTLGSWEAFLVAVVVAGIIQFLFGMLKLGFVAYFFPSSVIKGMLSGIGALIILKQIPHALGYDVDFEGAESFMQLDGDSAFDGIIGAWNFLTPGALLIAMVSFAILILWEKVLTKQHRFFQIVQGPVVVVVVGILLNMAYQQGWLAFALDTDQVVNLGVIHGIGDVLASLSYPNFAAVDMWLVLKVAFVMALIASLETLLCVEATDKLDPQKRITPTNQELKAQGFGNVVSGLIGGLPITQVIVRSSANITFGARTKLSAILHGVFLFISVISIAPILNKIPLASLASILILIGYKLVKPKLFWDMYHQGREQFFPFIITFVVLLFTDLLTGIVVGLLVGLLFSLHHSYRNSFYMKDTTTLENGMTVHHVVLAEEVSFFNKASIIELLNGLPPHSKIIIDCSNSKSIAHDVIEAIIDFRTLAPRKHITVETIGFIEPKYI